MREVHAALPNLTGGEGVLESWPAGHRPVRGTPPRRRTVDPGGPGRAVRHFTVDERSHG